MKLLMTTLALAAIALVSGCVAVPVADYPAQGPYYYRPAPPPLYYGPAINFRFGYGRGWYGHRH